jgi:outer membrane protein TolC
VCTALLVAGGWIGGPGVAAAVELDLVRAVDRALGHNPALKAVEEQRAEVRAGVIEARADAFPQVAFFSNWGRSRNPALLNSPDFEDIIENLPGGFTPREQELTGLGLEVTQPIFTFGKIGAALELARRAADVAEARIDTARLDVALMAAESYYEVLAARRALETVEEQERARRESLVVVEARFEIGEATRLELLQSQALLAELLPDLELAQGRLRRAEAALRTVLDLPPDEPLELPTAVEEGLAETPPLVVLLGLAADRRPELADLELQQEVLSGRQRVTRADGLPQIEFEGQYGREVRLVENLEDDLFASWSVGVGLRWEFFDGGRRKGEIAQFESQRRQLDWQVRDLLNRIRLEIEQARTDYETARARHRAAQVAADAAREASRVARESYQEGVALQADWLDAAQRATEAEIRLVEAYYTARVEAARLARALGQLPAENGPGSFAPQEAAAPGSERTEVR